MAQRPLGLRWKRWTRLASEDRSEFCILCPVHSPEVTEGPRPLDRQPNADSTYHRNEAGGGGGTRN